MSNNPRNVDRDDLSPGRSGIGTHATHRNEAAATTRDNKEAGREAHRADQHSAAGSPQQHAGGSEPMTADQAERLRILSAEAAEPFDASLGRAEADRRIHDLQRQAGLKP